MLIRVIDFETTGFPPEAGIVEIGWCDVTVQGNPQATNESVYSIIVGDWQSELCNPGRKIEIAAKAIHHITDEDVVGMRTPEVVLRELQPGVDYWVAHNAKFEKEFFTPVDAETGAKIPWICTLKAAYILCPSAPNHQNQTIRYFLNTPVNKADAIHTHRAGPDAYVTAHTLAKFLERIPPQVLSKWEGEPAQFPTCPIGKERGKAWKDVDHGFLSWMCFKAPTLEDDIKACALKEFNRRKGNR